MLVGILYESKEWSSYALEQKLNEQGVKTLLIDMQEDFDIDIVKQCDVLINRVFASSVFRKHFAALKNIEEVILYAKEKGVMMINPGIAHSYEINKQLSTKILQENNIAVPNVQGVYYPCDMKSFIYPCIIKPNCGGRTNYTYIINNQEELENQISTMPHIEFIVQEYIKPKYGYLTRIEVIDDECKLILKRSVTESGLSAYNLGSTYSQYFDCNQLIKNAAIKAMNLLNIEMGSMDIIENDTGFYIIDVNAVSNTSEDTIETFQFDLMKEMATYIKKRIQK